MRRSLRIRLIALVLSAALPLSAFVGYQLVRLYDHLHDQARMESERDAQLVAVSLERFVHQTVEQGQAVGLAVVDGGLDRTEADAYLASLGRHSAVSDYTILRPDGTVIASTRPEEGSHVRELPAFARVLAGKPYALSDVQPGSGGGLGFTVVAPVAGPKGRAVVAIHVDESDLAVAIPEETGSGRTLVTDASGHLALTNTRALRTARKPGSTLADVAAVRAALGGATFTSDRTRLPGVSSLQMGAQMPVPGTDWTAGFYRSTNVALGHVSDELLTAMLAVVAILASTSLIAWRVSAGVLRPVHALTAAARRVTAGDLETPVDVRAEDEVGVLAHAFAEMQSSLTRTFEAVGSVAEGSRRIAETMDPKQISLIGLEHLARLLHADSAAITIFRAADGRPRVYGRGTDDPATLASEMRRRVRDSSLSGRTRRTALIEPPTPAQPCTRFLVSLPLTADGEMIGRVDLVCAPEHGVPEFERSDVELATGLAQELGIAMANARRFETERTISQTLQDALLTKPFPIPGAELGLAYRPATAGSRVGGDFYDFIRIDDTRVAIVLGDISGKGIAAARHTAAAKGALRSFALDDPSPASVLTRANTAISEQLDVGTFVTAFYALLDTATGAVRYANAGHPCPFLVSPAGDPSVLFTGGTPLGVRPGTRYDEARVVLGEGERLVVYSDGLTEARSEDGAMLGDDGVGSVLARTKGTPQQIANTLALAAEEHAQRSLADDLAVIVLERSGTTGVASGGLGRERRHS